jgi:hypothetical protein
MYYFLKKYSRIMVSASLVFVLATSLVIAQTNTYTYIPPQQFSTNLGTGVLLLFTAQYVTQTTALITGKAAVNTPPFTVYLDTEQTGSFTDHFSPQIKSDRTFAYTLTGLSPSFSYHFVAIQSSDNRTRLSEINTFTTPKVDAKLYVSKLTDVSATITAAISEGAKNPAIVYSTQADHWGTPTSMSLADGVYSAPISGLKANTNYYYQLIGDSYQKPGTKVYYSAVLSFVTLPKAPVPAGTIPTMVGATNATANILTYNLGALVQCGIATGQNPDAGPLNKDGTQACGFPQFMELLNRIINFLIFLVAPIIAVCVILYAGFLILTSGGSTEKVSQARGMLTKMIVGLVIAMGAWLLVKAILVSLGVDTTVFPVFY